MPYIVFGFYFVILLVGPYLGWRLVRALERKSASKEEVRELREGLQSLEHRVAELTSELHALEEGQRFVTTALSARTADRSQGEKP